MLNKIINKISDLSAVEATLEARLQNQVKNESNDKVFEVLDFVRQELRKLRRLQARFEEGAGQ